MRSLPRFLLFLPFLVVPTILVSPIASALADPPSLPTAPRPHAYAVVVGSNTGGAGQPPLHFAEDDALRMAQVLREVGHFQPGDVTVLLHPSPSQIFTALEALGAKTRDNASRGEQTEVVFYYSGHARATAINLAGDDLALGALRERLSALPTALTIVILDACQSGAFARVKGAEPAADFTYNSVSKLTQKGLAIMASSSPQELSQESDELHGSYFTHHLVTALRGAGDADGDGRVSLDEAYRYAYRRTLASTARTQVGEQHVTLETDLAGQGDVPMTYPADARAQLELPGPLDARVLVQRRPGGSVMAEVQKAPGAALRLAFVAGAYDAVVGQAAGMVQCRFALGDDHVMVLDTSSCTPVVPDRSQAKGDGTGETGSVPLREIDRWTIEGAVGAMSRQSDGFTRTLQTFGYSEQSALGLPALRFDVGASRLIAPHIAGVLQVGNLSGDTYQRSIASSTDTASFSAYGAGIYVRTFTDVAGRWLGVYGQAGAGFSLGLLNYQTQQAGVPPSTTQTYGSYLLSGAVGMTFRARRVPVTFFAQAGYDYAPAIRDLIGDVHDSGGFSGLLGLRVRLGDGQ
ncbi:MAG: caspase family protein [Polyangiaceae bacterium]